MPGIEVKQRQVQKQVQVLSQKQKQSIEILGYDGNELRSAIFKEVDENPALYIAKDDFQDGLENYSRRQKNRISTTYTREGKATAAGNEASQNFQNAMEAVCDQRKPLKEHLLSQLNMMNISQKEYVLCEKLIHNLDGNGFHILSPYSLLDSQYDETQRKFLEGCMDIVQQMDPEGICVQNHAESLFVQAKHRQNVPPYTMLILDHFEDFLNPPQPEKIAKKVNAFLKEQKKLFGQQQELEEAKCTVEDAETALNFITRLDPFPARDFGTDTTIFVVPDVYVKELPGEYEASDFKNGIVSDGVHAFKVTLNNTSIPQLEISPSYKKIHDLQENQDQKLKGYSAQSLKEIEKGLKSAQEFIEAIEERQSTVLLTSLYIVQRQMDYFVHGPGHLKPLSQREIAELLEYDDSTISRATSGKYISCKWGLVELKKLFTTSVNKVSSSASTDETAGKEANAVASKDNVLHELELILEEHKNDPKKLSDQKLSDILAERGFQVARRTVAKYRSQLEIESSYSRV